MVQPHGPRIEVKVGGQNPPNKGVGDFDGVAVGVDDMDALVQAEEERVREEIKLLDGNEEGLEQGEGFTDMPVVPQAAGQVQGVGAPDPAGQKLPMGQITAVALQDPAGQ